MSALALAKKHTQLPLAADWPFNIFNSEAVGFLADAGVARVCLSPELTMTQIEALTKKASLPLECLIHGKVPLMISA